MVRSLSGTLTSAVGAKNRRPYISCTIEDHINHLQQSVSASNSDGYNDMCVAADGSIIRVRVTRGGNAFQQSFQWQRITDPTVGSQWTTWTKFTGGSGNCFQDGGCAVAKTGGTINAFVQQGTGGNALWNWFSNDGGQTWSGAPGTVLSPPGSALIKGISASGNSDVFFLYDVTGGDAMGASFFTTGWSALQTWTLPTAQSGAGLTTYWDGSKYIVAYSDGYALKLATCNSNATSWTAQQDIAATTNTALARYNPRIALFDGLYQLICTEADSGFLTGTVYSYPRIRQSLDGIHWSNGAIYQDVTTTYGGKIVKCTPPNTSRARYIMAHMSGVMLGLDFQQSDATQYLNVSSKILSYKRIDQLDRPSNIELILDNSNSNLTQYVSNYGIQYQPIGIFTKVVLNEGYYTGTPPVTQEAINTGTYHIKQIIYERAPGVSEIKIIAEDLTQLLDHKNRYQVNYINWILSSLLTDICARAGILNISLPTTSQMSTSVPYYTLHAGQKYRQAIDELCRVGWLEYFMDQNETMQFRELSASDSSVWSYQPEIESWSIGTDDIRANHVVVSGLPPAGGPLGSITNGEAYDTVHAHVTGLERLETDSDVKLTTTALCATSANFIMQQEIRDQYGHSVEVPANPALQLIDVISTSDISAQSTGISNSSRILRSEVTFNAEHSEFWQTIHLEGV